MARFLRSLIFLFILSVPLLGPVLDTVSQRNLESDKSHLFENDLAEDTQPYRALGQNLTEAPLEGEEFIPVSSLGYRLRGANFVYEGTGRSDLFPVAIIDTGADHNHEKISPFLHLNNNTNEIVIDSINIQNDLFGFDFADNDLNAFDDYSFYYSYETVTGEYFKNFFKFGAQLLIEILVPSTPGHGTHVTGTMLQACDNLCSVVPIRIKGSGTIRTLREVKRAVEYAKIRGYKLVNMSLGFRHRDIYNVDDDGTLTFEFKSDEIKVALDELNHVMEEAKEMLFVVAAGNETIHFQVDNEYSFPINFRLPNILVVGAVDEDGRLASFSNFDRDLINLYAHGVAVTNAWPRNTYRHASGTSMASPLVAGLVGNLWTKNSSLSNLEIKSKFLNLLEERTLEFSRSNHKTYVDHTEQTKKPVITPGDVEQLRDQF